MSAARARRPPSRPSRRPSARAALLAARFPPALRARAAGIRLVGIDSDGTFTDRGMVWNGEGVEERRFDVRDGIAMVWAKRAGLHVIVISGRTSHALGYRMEDLGLPFVQAARDKVEVLSEICRGRAIGPEEVAFVGDDLPDLPALRWCGLPIAVADAHPLVRRAAAWVTASGGGHGAVREALEAVLDATGLWPGVLAHYGEAP